MNRRWIAVAVLVLLLAVSVILAWPAIDRWVLHRKIYTAQSGRQGYIMGFAHLSRLSGEPDGPQLVWHVRTGMIAAAAELDDGLYRLTLWDTEGRVLQQAEGPYGNTPTVARAPPWLWGVTDQEAPSAPWLEAGLTPREWWGSVEPRHGPPLPADLSE